MEFLQRIAVFGEDALNAHRNLRSGFSVFEALHRHDALRIRPPPGRKPRVRMDSRK